MANLIYRGYVKGYISHQKAVLVVSKKDPENHRRRNEEVKSGGCPTSMPSTSRSEQRHTQIPAALDVVGPVGREEERVAGFDDSLDGAARDLFIRLGAARAIFSSRQAALVPLLNAASAAFAAIIHVHAQPPRRRRVVGSQRLQAVEGHSTAALGTGRLY